MIDLTPAASVTTARGGCYVRLSSGKVWWWCPKCDTAQALPKMIEVRPDGGAGQLVCTCGWAGLVRLAGWEPEPPEA